MGQMITDRPELLTMKQVAEWLHVDCRTVRRWCSRFTPAHRRLRVIRLGHRTVRIHPNDVERWLVANQTWTLRTLIYAKPKLNLTQKAKSLPFSFMKSCGSRPSPNDRHNHPH